MGTEASINICLFSSSSSHFLFRVTRYLSFSLSLSLCLSRDKERKKEKGRRRKKGRGRRERIEIVNSNKSLLKCYSFNPEGNIFSLFPSPSFSLSLSLSFSLKSSKSEPDVKGNKEERVEEMGYSQFNLFTLFLTPFHGILLREKRERKKRKKREKKKFRISSFLPLSLDEKFHLESRTGREKGRERKKERRGRRWYI